MNPLLQQLQQDLTALQNAAAAKLQTAGAVVQAQDGYDSALANYNANRNDANAQALAQAAAMLQAAQNADQAASNALSTAQARVQVDVMNIQNWSGR